MKDRNEEGSNGKLEGNFSNATAHTSIYEIERRVQTGRRKQMHSGSSERHLLHDVSLYHLSTLALQVVYAAKWP